MVWDGLFHAATWTIMLPILLLLAAGSDPSIRDTKHDADAIHWADFFKQPEIVRILRGGSPRL